MFRKEKSLLGALLLTSCSFGDGLDDLAFAGIGDRNSLYYSPAPKKVNSLVYSGNPSGNSSYNGNNPTILSITGSRSLNGGLVEVTPDSARIGPLELSVTPNRDAVGLKVLPFLSAVQFPIDSYIDLDNHSRGYFQEGRFSRRDEWMVGNRDSNRYAEENAEIPISVLGKAAREFIERTIKPVREFADTVSGLSDWPTEVVFGEGVTPKFGVRADQRMKRAGISYELRFNGTPYFLRVEHEFALEGSEEEATRLSFGFN